MYKIFSNLKLSKKIALSFILVIFVWALVISYLSFIAVNDNTDMIVAHAVIASSVAVIVCIFVYRALSDSIIGAISNVNNILNHISNGDLTIEIFDKFNGSNDEIGMLSKTAKELKEDLENLIEDIKTIKEEVITYGNIDFRIKEDNYRGSYREMVKGINEYKESFILDIIEVINAANSIQDGNFEISLSKLPGKKIILTTAITSLVNNLKDVSQEIENIMTGESYEIDTKKYSGEWEKIMIHLNALIKTSIPLIGG